VPASGQQNALKFSRLTTESIMTSKGLSQNSIYCLLQDSRGFIWMGTWDGLNKYDGYDFIIYNTTNGLSNPTINALLEDDEKNIWIGTDYGLNILDRMSGEINHFYHEPDNPNCISDDFIQHLYQDSKGYIWISTAFGLDRYDKNQKIFTSFSFFERGADSALTNFVSCVKEDLNGKIWIGTHRGIHCFDPVKSNFNYYKLEPDESSAAYTKGNFVQDLAFDENGLVYTATLNGVYVISDCDQITHLLRLDKDSEWSISGNEVNALLVDTRGMVWIGTSTGLDLYDPSLNTITSFKAGANITSLSNADVKCIYQDHAGTIWIGTYKGLNKVDSSPSRFNHFYHDPEDPSSLSDNIVYSILEDEKELVWIGTYGGVNIFDRKKEKFLVIRHNPDNPASLSSDKIRTLALDSSGYIWAGTESKGLNRIDRKTGIITHYLHQPGDPSSIVDNNILSMLVDSKNRLWIGTASRGVTILDLARGRYEHLTESAESTVRLADNRVLCIYEDRKGIIWLGTNKGLHKISPDLQSISIYVNNPSNPNSIGIDRVLSINEDSDGIFWIGTMGGGLNRFDPLTEKFKTYAKNEGLQSNVVYAALEDEEGFLWLSTNWGLAKFDQQIGFFVNYDTKDGVQSNEFNAGAFFKNRKGDMFFGGMNGINIFHPSEIVLNQVPPRIVFTGFRILNDLSDTDLEDGEIIRLNYNENFFSIEFSGLDYTNPNKNLFRYMLENYDNGWVTTNAGQRRAEYRKVDPGTYRFKVTGSNNDGFWNEQGISLTIIISPPWWRSWVFRLSFALFLISTLWSIILLRIRNIRKKHEVEKKMLYIEKQVFELEQKALRLQMNPHFLFNSLNAIQNFVLANETDKAVNYLAKFSYLMRMILANSTSSLINLKDELKALTYYIDLEKLRFDNKFDYRIIRDPAIDEEFIEIPPMLFQPYVENSIIHGLVNSPKPGLLEISISRQNPETLLCIIQDNGIGREKAIEIRNQSGIKRQPKGMMITQERIEIFNKQNNKNFAVRITDLKDESGEPAGTRVEFTIQIKNI
jgi:ligand-binding sensor domain-containing protein